MGRVSLFKATLALAAIFIVSLVATSQANAACMSTSDCLGAAMQKRGVANQLFSQGLFYQAAANQSRAKGDYQAAGLYAAAANQKFKEAQFVNAAANGDGARALFFAGGVISKALYPADPGDVGSSCASGDICAAGLSKKCKSHPMDNYWHGDVAGSDVYRAHVKTQWCWRNGVIVSRHSDTGEHGITDFGHLIGFEVDLGPDMVHSYCNAGKTACFTRFQFGFRGPEISTAGGCIETTIYGDGHHYRKAYGGTCSRKLPF
jgi:hypothetical protein